MIVENTLVARICHDLITPLNAINLGIEAFEASHDEELLAMIKESVAKANTIMKFVREMFANRAESFCYSSLSLNQIIAEYLKFYSIKFDLKSDTEEIVNVVGKIAMYMAEISKEIMPYGGTVSAQICDTDETITIKCCGRDVSVPDMSTNQEMTHKNIFRYMLSQQLNEIGMKLTANGEENSVVFCLKFSDV